jgi:ribokinase
MVKIAVLASFNMDLVMRAERRPVAGETLQGEFAMFLGGKGFNQAVAARRLGAEVVVTGRVGDDEFGGLFLDALDREGIDRQAVVIDRQTGTGVASIIVEPDGTNTILQDPQANRNVRADDIVRATTALFGADMAMLQLETSDDGAKAFAATTRAAGCPVLLNPAPAGTVAPDLLGLVDIIVPNEIEAKLLTGREVSTVGDAFAAAGKLVFSGPTIGVITLGDRGAIGVSAGARVAEPRFDVVAIDTVGAGDAFCAALAVRLAEGADLADAMRFANAAGALACTKRGAEPSMPYRTEVEALLATRG